jgi:hypothetical protein
LVQGEGRLPRRPLIATAPVYAPPEMLPGEGDGFLEFTDRWRIVPPPYELNVRGSRWDPYNQNVLKGDLPIRGQDLFLVLTGVSDTLAEVRQVPTPSGVSTTGTGIGFFGGADQLFLNQNVIVSAELFRGDTAFRPPDWRVKATLVGNVNHIEVEENAVVKPDVRRGTTRTDGRGSLQEAFVEVKLAEISPHYAASCSPTPPSACACSATGTRTATRSTSPTSSAWRRTPTPASTPSSCATSGWWWPTGTARTCR